jgi:hypothetical protein
MSATIAVTANAPDVLNGANASCSLREAITNINNGALTYADCPNTGGAYGASDTINIPAGTYTTTIATTIENLNADGDYDILRSVAIVGAGAGSTIIDGGAIADRVFHIPGAFTVSISGVTIQNGTAGATSGGGIYSANGNTLTITNSTISGNTTGGSGGGIYNWGTLTVTNSTISGNTATNTSGGGILNAGAVTTVTNSTIVRNSAINGGGILNAGTVTVTNSIVADNVGALDCVGAITNGGGNIDKDSSCTGFTHSVTMVQGTGFSALASNGGATQTHALLAGSAAIDTAPTCAGLTTDQRGTARPQGGACDIGAYEYGVAATSSGISGCTNSHAENYNPSATVDDGSCRVTHPDFSGNASTVNVGNTPVNGKATKTITITNSGNGSTYFYNVDISGAPFTIVSENCSGKSIAPGKSCDIVVAFDPKAKGAFTGTLKLWSNSGSYRPLTISLSGVGSGDAPSAAGLVTPADGESVTGTTVTFTWNLGADNGSGALTHKVFVCESKDFTGCETPSGISRTESDTPMGVTILIAGLLAPFGWRNRRKMVVWAIGALLAGGLTISACGGGSASKVEGSNKQTVSGLKASTTYYWKVTEVTADGSSADSSVRSFTTGK